jgi:uncharacterized membrane protein
MSVWWTAYAVAWLVVAALDALWLGFIARDLYAREMGALMAASVRKLPAALFYLGYPAGLVTLALPLPPADAAAVLHAALRGALVGLVAYGTYDLTNLAVVRGFSARLALLDMAWGTGVGALAAGAAAWFVMPRA